MRKIKFIARLSLTLAVAGFLSVGCQTSKQDSSMSAPSEPKPATVAATTTAAVVPAATPVTTKGAIRIDAGSTVLVTDSSGNVWLADQGFVGGDVVDRGNGIAIANTKDAAIYRTERYGMESFSQTLPNGKYVVKLHFAETYGEEITGAGLRVFSFTVNGREFKDFDVFAKAGGSNRAYVETIPVEITDGELTIKFTAGVQNPEINGIEILPAS